MKSLTNTEEIMLLASVRYFIGRTSIVATTFPCNIIQDLLPRMDENQIEKLRRELEYGIDSIKDYDDTMKLMDEWITLLDYLTPINKCIVLIKDGDEIACFKSHDKYIPIKQYLEHPYPLTYIDKKMISKINTIDKL